MTGSTETRTIPLDFTSVDHEMSMAQTDSGYVARCSCGFCTDAHATFDAAFEALRPHWTARDEAMRAAEPDRTPCPPWCAESGKEMHGYDLWTADGTTWSRFHELHAGADGSWAVAREETVSGDGVRALGPVEISYHGAEICTDVAGALGLIADIRAAIEKAREIDRCKCGKPLTHLDAHPDSPEWACRVPEAARFPNG